MTIYYMNYSAKELCTLTAMHLKIKQLNPLYKGYEPSYSNPMGCYNTKNGNKIYFSPGIITKFSVMHYAYDDFKNALLQCALYKSLIMIGYNKFNYELNVNGKKELKTIKIDKCSLFYLNFKGKCYIITVFGAKPIVDFFLKKISSTNDIDRAHAHDLVYEKEKYDLLSRYFNYYKL